MQAYSDPSRVDDPFALPDLEVFWLSAAEAAEALDIPEGEREESLAGLYWWSCLPGCMPDSDPTGPFQTQAEALADARELIQFTEQEEEV